MNRYVGDRLLDVEDQTTRFLTVLQIHGKSLSRSSRLQWNPRDELTNLTSARGRLDPKIDLLIGRGRQLKFNLQVVTAGI